MIDALCIVNNKLFSLCDKKAEMAKRPADFSKEDFVNLAARDIELCKTRAGLKNSINSFFGQKTVEVKEYGSN